jgi:hypothetical protein
VVEKPALHADRTDEFATGSFLGSSVRILLAESPGGESLWAEALLHKGSFVLRIFESDRNGKVRMVDHSLTAEGDMSWLQRTGKDVYIGIPPASARDIELTIGAVMASGLVVKRNVMIDPRLVFAETSDGVGDVPSATAVAPAPRDRVSSR